MFDALKTEKAYYQIPNFTAADMIKQLGIGRNEYINILNQCKSKKLMWKVNRNVAREYLPQQPLGPQPQKWWRIKVTSLSESESKHLGQLDYQFLTECDKMEEDKSPLSVKNVDDQILWSLYCRGFVYFQVPIQANNKFNIPPLEGFVSNKDAAEGGDPQDALLYNIFVAHSAHLTAQELSNVLDVPLPTLSRAVATAVRLGFASLIEEGQGYGSQHGQPKGKGDIDDLLQMSHDFDMNEDHSPASEQVQQKFQQQLNLSQAQNQQLPPSPQEQKELEAASDKAVGVIVDAEVTSYLMMGALSPGMKRHAVTLFEGGRLKGNEQIDDMQKELKASLEIAQGFEGDMKNLSVYAESLAILLETLKFEKSSRSVELLRKESLAGLNPDAVQNVLSHQYFTLLQVSPLPYPPLPCPPLDSSSPLNFGPLPSACTPWIQLALYNEAQDGPVSLVFPRGLILNQLPPQLEQCQGCLFWLWDPYAIPKQGNQSTLYGSIWIEKKFLLLQLNYWLQKSALLVQPVMRHEYEELHLSCIPLPQSQFEKREITDLDFEGHTSVEGIDYKTSQRVNLKVANKSLQGLQNLGIFSMIGYLTMILESDLTYRKNPNKKLQVSEAEKQLEGLTLNQGSPRNNKPQETPIDSINNSNQYTGQVGLNSTQNDGIAKDDLWIPLAINLGVPLHEVRLCESVCEQARKSRTFSSEFNKRGYREKQISMYRKMQEIVSLFSVDMEDVNADNENQKGDVLLTGNSILQGFTHMPAVAFMFNKHYIDQLDLQQIQQGYQLIV